MKQLYEMYEDYGKGTLIYLFIDLFFYLWAIVFIFIAIYFLNSLPSTDWEVFFTLSFLGINLYCFIMIMSKIEDIYKVLAKPKLLKKYEN